MTVLIITRLKTSSVAGSGIIGFRCRKTPDNKISGSCEGGSKMRVQMLESVNIYTNANSVTENRGNLSENYPSDPDIQSGS